MHTENLTIHTCAHGQLARRVCTCTKLCLRLLLCSSLRSVLLPLCSVGCVRIVSVCVCVFPQRDTCVCLYEIIYKYGNIEIYIFHPLLLLHADMNLCVLLCCLASLCRICVAYAFAFVFAAPYASSSSCMHALQSRATLFSEVCC